MNIVRAGSVIRDKTSDFFKSIEDECLKVDVINGTIVMGGAIASLLSGEKPNDYDIYFRRGDIARNVMSYYLGVIRKKGGVLAGSLLSIKDIEINPDFGTIPWVQPFVIGGSDRPIGAYCIDYPSNEILDRPDKVCEFIPVHISDNAISLDGGIQLVVRFYGEPENICETYDFAHCSGNWCSWTGGIQISNQALLSLLTKELDYIGTGAYPVSSLFRARKFMKRGFNARLSELLKIAFHLSQLDLSDPLVLEQQLIGMDVEYFQEVINHLSGDESSVSYDGLCLALEEALDATSWTST